MVHSQIPVKFRLAIPEQEPGAPFVCLTWAAGTNTWTVISWEPSLHLNINHESKFVAGIKASHHSICCGHMLPQNPHLECFILSSGNSILLKCWLLLSLTKRLLGLNKWNYLMHLRILHYWGFTVERMQQCQSLWLEPCLSPAIWFMSKHKWDFWREACICPERILQYIYQDITWYMLVFLFLFQTVYF